MSDLGAIFHVKKDGVQYDAHAYTTLDECPEPNLKIKFNGSPAYVKLEAKGSGDVPCYVKKSNGSVFQVKKVAVAPTGGTTIIGVESFTVPSGIHVIEINSALGSIYVGVTPNTTHSIYINVKKRKRGTSINYDITIGCNSHNKIYIIDRIFHVENEEPSNIIFINWSPEINENEPTVTDY